MTAAPICIYPGCQRPAVAAHPLGGPPSRFCDREDHNALTAHQERQRLRTDQAGAQERGEAPRKGGL